ncbi:DUF222 domain-containing protein [Actinomadura sp. 6N118]|uniref:HNH endonuclease signature motif containing protein n=1 Tax=Actinomadura sp. 6N118 TaxID=3375151 RepID=UPI003794E2BA
MVTEEIPPGGTTLPSELAGMPPGPELAALLATVDRDRLSGYDAVDLLRARARQIAYEQAELAADMMTVADRVQDATADMSSVWSSDLPRLVATEVGAALTLTKRAAQSRYEDAWALVNRLPDVWSALRRGCIDQAKAKVLVERTGVLSEALARQVAATVLPEAPELTTGQLDHRLHKLVVEADPEALRRDYQRGVDERWVEHGLSANGTARLNGRGLPVDQAAAAFERIDAMARAAKQSGDDRPMDQIRSDVYLGLLAGTWEGAGPMGRRGVLEITCDLATLMGLREGAAELHGWGHVIADIARQAARRSAAGGDDTVWRFSITDPVSGELINHGTTRARPSHPARDQRRYLTGRDRAFVIARDRTCRGPGCRVPAQRTEIDHIVDHAKGGPSVPANCDSKCTPCHHLKDQGWRVSRNRLGDTIWTSPLGRVYRKAPEPITPPRDYTPLERHLSQNVRRQM